MEEQFKYMILIIMHEKDQKYPIKVHIISVRPTMTPDEEKSIKYALELKNNDFCVFKTIIQHEAPSIRNIQPFWDETKKIIEECDAIDVSFIDNNNLENFKKSITEKKFKSYYNFNVMNN